MSDDVADGPSPSLRIAFAPGVTPGKWARIWSERMPRVPLELLPVEESDQLTVLDDGTADMSFVRLPVERDGLSLIPLYREVPVVVVPKDHVVAAFDEVSVDDLADEHLLQDPDQVPEWRDLATELRDGTRLDLPEMTTKQAVEVVAAGSGVIIVPMSVARLHHRKDVTYRPVTGVAESQIGLAWSTGATDERIETFIGIVRGRTARSSRGDGDAAQEKRPDKKTPARGAAARNDGTRKPGPKKQGQGTAKRMSGRGAASRRRGRR